jgi:hypothetical protein
MVQNNKATQNCAIWWLKRAPQYVYRPIFFIVHQIGRNEIAHTVADALNFKPHQKYFQ